MRRIWLLLPMVGLTLAAAGCRSTCGNPPQKTVVVPPPPGQVVQPTAGFGPPAAFPTVPPPAFGQPAAPPGAPPPAAKLVPPIPQQPQPPSITPLPGGSSSNRVETDWQAGGPKQPDIKANIQLYAPEAIDKEKPAPTNEPPLAKKPSVQGSFPAIPQFAVAKDNVFTGTRPPLDGLDWLERNGVRTVINIRAESADDSTDRAEVEKRKMQYVPFAVSPKTLTKEKVDEFVKVIRDGAKQGVFVYDADSSLAGPLWYLYFRRGEFLDDDAAQLRAGQLGLRPDAPAQRDMWIAVQKVLAEDNR